MTVEIQSRKPFTTPMLNLYEAKKKARKLSREGHTIESIGDEEVIDMCEACGGPIMDDQSYNYDDDSVTWHKNEADCL